MALSSPQPDSGGVKPPPVEVSISAVVPLFGDVGFIQECLASLAHQASAFDEVILVDDANENPLLTALIEQMCIEQDRWTILVMEKPSGIVASTRAGVAVSRSDYVAMIDCDDLLASQAVARIRQALSTLRPNLLSTRYVTFDGREGSKVEYPAVWELRDVYSSDLALGLEHLFLSHLKVARRNFLLEEGLQEGTDGVQDWFMAIAAIQSNSYLLLNESLYAHRLHAGQTTHTSRSHFLKSVNDRRSEILGKRARTAIPVEVKEDLLGVGLLLKSSIPNLVVLPGLLIGRDKDGLFAIPGSLPFLEICLSERKPDWVVFAGSHWFDFGALDLKWFEGGTFIGLAVSIEMPNSIHMAKWYSGYLDMTLTLDSLSPAILAPYQADNNLMLRCVFS